MQGKWKWKDASPDNTVAHIQSLLRDAGISWRYESERKGVADCFSSRITLRDDLSFLGANGKGASESYCAASAFAELIERLQNRHFAYRPSPDDTFYRIDGEGIGDSDYALASFEEAIESEGFAPFLARLEDSMDGDDRAEKARTLMRALRPDGPEKPVLMSPFYCPSEGRYVLLPTDLLKAFTGSTGMAAGNTYAEAMIQALCEIFERHVLNLLLTRAVTPPDIPRDWIREHCPGSMRIIDSYEADGRFYIVAKDASMKLGLPVMLALIFDRHTGTFSFRLGSHPEADIALERCLTECLQGYSRENAASLNQFSFNPRHAQNPVNRLNLLSCGVGYLPNSLFLSEPSYLFSPWPAYTGADNRATLHALIALVEGRLCAKIYIEDVSFLGFPTVYVYAQNIAQAKYADRFSVQEIMAERDVRRALRDPAGCDDSDFERILLWRRMNAQCIARMLYVNPLGIPFHRDSLDYPDAYWWVEAICYYRLGDVRKAREVLSEAVKALRRDAPGYLYAHAAEKNLEGMLTGADEGQRAALLTLFFGKEAAVRVLSDMREPGCAPARMLPRCNHFDCDTCENHLCDYPALRAFFTSLNKKMIDANCPRRHLHTLFE